MHLKMVADRVLGAMKIVLLCIALLIALPSCSPRSSTERLLVGKWEGIEHQPDRSQSVTEIEFTRYGIYRWSFHGKPPVVTGRWRLDGQELVTTIENQAKDSGLPELPPQMKYRIVRVTKHELVVTDGTTEARWTRAR